MIRVGISVTSSHLVEDPREGARHMIERAAAARDAGLDTLFVGDHHVTPFPYYQNNVVLARMLAEWGDKPFGALYLLPLWHPITLAEQVGTLASLAPGRFIMQCGLGDERQGDAMGIDMSKKVGLFLASLRTLRALWQGEAVSEEKYWGIRDARISPVPAEPVDVWIGASVDAAPTAEKAVSVSSFHQPVCLDLPPICDSSRPQNEARPKDALGRCFKCLEIEGRPRKVVDFHRSWPAPGSIEERAMGSAAVSLLACRWTRSPAKLGLPSVQRAFGKAVLPGQIGR